jgi:hypothetical protein
MWSGCTFAGGRALNSSAVRLKSLMESASAGSTTSRASSAANTAPTRAAESRRSCSFATRAVVGKLAGVVNLDFESDILLV